MTLKSIISVIVIILVILLAVWYYYANLSPQAQQSQNIKPVGDTTGVILDDLNQLPSSSSLESDLNSLDEYLKNF